MTTTPNPFVFRYLLILWIILASLLGFCWRSFGQDSELPDFTKTNSASIYAKWAWDLGDTNQGIPGEGSELYAAQDISLLTNHPWADTNAAILLADTASPTITNAWTEMGSGAWFSVAFAYIDNPQSTYTNPIDGTITTNRALRVRSAPSNIVPLSIPRRFGGIDK